MRVLDGLNGRLTGESARGGLRVMGCRSAQEGRKVFVLICSEIVDPGIDCSLPASLHGFARAKVVAAKPTAATQVCGCGPVECVETDPKTLLVRVAHEFPQAFVLLWRPRTSF